MYTIYMATNLENGHCYIGMTKQRLGQRISQHYKDARTFKPACRVFHEALRLFGKDRFQWCVLASTNTRIEALNEETRQIRLHKPEYNLLKTGWRRPQSFRDHLRKSLKGRGITEEQRRLMLSKIRPENKYKPVVCVNDNMTFPGIKIAAAYYGISHKSIGGALSGKEQIYATGDRLFVYGESPLPEKERERLIGAAKERAANRWHGRGNRRAVVCIETGVEYESCRAAAIAIGCSNMRITQSCQDNGSLILGAYRFQYAKPLLGEAE